MDSDNLLLYILLLTAVPRLIDLVCHLALYLVHTISFSSTRDVYAIDCLLLKSALLLNGTHYQSGCRKPQNDKLHVVLHDGHYVVCWRSRGGQDKDKPTYQLFSLGRLESFPRRLEALDGSQTILEMWFEPTSHDWQFAYPLKIHTSLPLKSSMYPCQAKVISQLVPTFLASAIRNTSCIIQGPSKSGKSTTARYLASELQERGLSPVVVSGFLPTADGMIISLLDGRFEVSKQSPMILLLDEYDVMVDQAKCSSASNGSDDDEDEDSAESKKSGGKASKTISTKNKTCYCYNKSTFLLFMDRLRALSNVIVMATMNKSGIVSQNSGVWSNKEEDIPFYNSARLELRFVF